MAANASQCAFNEIRRFLIDSFRAIASPFWTGEKALRLLRVARCVLKRNENTFDSILGHVFKFHFDDLASLLAAAGVGCQRPPALPCGLPTAGCLAPLGW